eukprot:scaffold151942_cov28-Attheya_sp.AAC.1
MEWQLVSAVNVDWVEWRPLSSSLGFVFFSFFTNLAREPYSRLNSYRYRYRGASRISDISTNADSTAMWRWGGIYRSDDDMHAVA